MSHLPDIRFEHRPWSHLSKFCRTTEDETLLDLSQIVASTGQCSSEHMTCIFRLVLVRFTNLFKLFQSPFQDCTTHLTTFDLLQVAWSNCACRFTSLQPTLNIRLQPFQQSVPSSMSETKYCCRKAPLIVSENKQARMGPAAFRTLASQVR